MSDSLWPLNCSTPGFPVLHYLPEFAQIPDCWVSDALQPSRLLLPPSPTSLNLSQHQGIFLMMKLFTSGGQSIGASNLASIIPMSIQGWFPIGLTGLISLQFKGLLGVFSSTSVQTHQVFGAQPSLWSNSYIHTWLLENHSFDYTSYRHI